MSVGRSRTDWDPSAEDTPLASGGRRIGLIATAESEYLLRVLNELYIRGNPPTDIFLGSWVERLLFRVRSLERIHKRHGVAEVGWRMLDRLRERPRRAEVGSVTVATSLEDGATLHRYDCINSGQLILDLRLADLDLLLLCGCGIVSRHVIGAARAVVNSHPALLPGVRGVDVVEWSLLMGSPLGVTAHLVVPRVDAGPVLATKSIHLNRGESLADLKARIFKHQAELLVSAALRLAAGDSTSRPQSLKDSQLFFASTHGDRKEASGIYGRLVADLSVGAGERGA